MSTPAPGAQISEDGHYWWDGTEWQLVDKQPDGRAVLFDPSVDGEFDPAKHGEFDPKKHGEFDPKKHGEFDPKKHGNYDPQVHGEFHQTRHGPHEAVRHGAHDPAIHGELSAERHGHAAVAAAAQHAAGHAGAAEHPAATHAPEHPAATSAAAAAAAPAGAAASAPVGTAAPGAATAAAADHAQASAADPGHAAAGGQVQYDQPPAPGPVALVNASGEVTAHGHAMELHRAGETHPAPHALQIAMEVGIGGLSAIPGVGIAVQFLELAHTLGCTIGVGLGEEADAVLGIAAGAGLYYTPSGEIGVYGSLGGDLGAVLGVGYSEILTVVHGGSDALAGNCLAVTLAGGDGVVGSGSLLFDGHNGHLVGVAGSIGLGIGWPVAVFESYSHTWVRPVS